MSAKSVLKATPTADPAAARVVLRDPLAAAVIAEAEPGLWISQADLEALQDRCFQQGRMQGEEQGRRLAQQAAQRKADEEARARLERELQERHNRHVQEQAEKWRGLAAALAGQMQALRRELETEVTEWTFVAIARLLGQRTPEEVAAMVRRVLAESRLDGPLTVLLHPQDLAGLAAGDGADASAWPDGVKLAADARVGAGGCQIQSDVQTLDARLDVQLALVREHLDDLRRERRASGAEL